MTALWLRDAAAVRPRWTVGIAVILLAADLLAVNLRADPLHAERVLAAYAASSPEPVWTNLSLGPLLQDERGVRHRVHVVPPNDVPPGSLYIVTKSDAVALDIANWPQLSQDDPAPSPLLRPLALLDGYSPKLARVIRRDEPSVLVLRAPSGPPGSR